MKSEDSVGQRPRSDTNAVNEGDDVWEHRSTGDWTTLAS